MELLKENKDYELIPLESNSEMWGVRIASGMFIETVIVFGSVGFNKVKDNLTFNFEVVSSPDPDLNAENEDLQQHCARILEAIVIDGVEDGTVELKDVDASES